MNFVWAPHCPTLPHIASSQYNDNSPFQGCSTFKTVSYLNFAFRSSSSFSRAAVFKNGAETRRRQSSRRAPHHMGIAVRWPTRTPTQPRCSNAHSCARTCIERVYQTHGLNPNPIPYAGVRKRRVLHVRTSVLRHLRHEIAVQCQRVGVDLFV